MKQTATVAIGILLILTFCVWYLFYRTDYNAYQETKHPELSVLEVGPFYYELETPEGTTRFNLVDPEQAPPEIRDEVELGCKIMHQTREYAKPYAGNDLSCIHCHFSSGNTFGGKNGSISLVGVTSWFPEYNERAGREMTLEERINNCFMRSLNGTPPPPDSPIMKALVTYMGWISKDVAHVKEMPWRGLIPLTSDHTPNPANGRRVYRESCAPCHMPNGAGVILDDNALQIPPLWGPESFNDGAGMNTLERLSSFIYYNMPYQQPTLTQEQALDVAAFMIKQPRPHFKDRNGG